MSDTDIHDNDYRNFADQAARSAVAYPLGLSNALSPDPALQKQHENEYRERVAYERRASALDYAIRYVSATQINNIGVVALAEQFSKFLAGEAEEAGE